MDFSIQYGEGSYTAMERTVLQFVGAHRGYYGDIKVGRRSDREFDLSIEGTIGELLDYKYEFTQLSENHSRAKKVPCEQYLDITNFRAWLPLAVLRMCWCTQKWGRFVDDQGTGDFSFVRDAPNEVIWDSFNRFIKSEFKY